MTEACHIPPYGERKKLSGHCERRSRRRQIGGSQQQEVGSDVVKDSPRQTFSLFSTFWKFSSAVLT
jgi:hypothetical protein